MHVVEYPLLTTKDVTLGHLYTPPRGSEGVRCEKKINKKYGCQGFNNHYWDVGRGSTLYIPVELRSTPTFPQVPSHDHRKDSAHRGMATEGKDCLRGDSKCLY